MSTDPTEPPDWSDAPEPEDDEDAEGDRLDDREDAETARVAASGDSPSHSGDAEQTPLVPVYDVRSSSLQSAEGEPIPLTLRPDDNTNTTRRVVTWRIVDNAKDPKANLQLKIHHQRRASTKDPWQNVDSYNPGKLKADEEVSINLHSAEVLKLFEEMTKLYELAGRGVPLGTKSFEIVDKSTGYTVITGEEGEALKALIAKHGDATIIEFLRKVAPDPLAAAGLVAMHEKRTAALAVFEEEMKAQRWTEAQWSEFFEANEWIFGHGLAYQFLNKLQDQAYVGGQGLDRKGAKKLDYFFETVGDVRFTVLVEIKKPDTKLLSDKPYRPGVYNMGDEVTGGVAQLQAYCDEWAKEGSGSRANKGLVALTYEPKGILVVGNLAQFSGEEADDKARSFELFRQSVHNPEIVTFDELLERARFIVSSANPNAETTS